MLVFSAAALGIAAVLGLSLVLKLRSIRRRGFGEGTRLALPDVGLEMRHPHWWKPVNDPAPRTARPGPEIVLKTGHSRGVLRITAWEENGGGDEASLRAGLVSVLREQGLELDDPEITIATARSAGSHPADGAASGNGSESPGGLRAWVASGGRQASRPEERTYFEVHLLALGGARVLLSYTNSVLQGFLDAYYLEKVLETLQPARFPR